MMTKEAQLSQWGQNQGVPTVRNMVGDMQHLPSICDNMEVSEVRHILRGVYDPDYYVESQTIKKESNHAR